MRQLRVPVTPTTPDSDLPTFLTVEQAAAYTQQCRWTVYKAVREGRLRNVGYGKKILIPKDCLLTARPEQPTEAAL